MIIVGQPRSGSTLITRVLNEDTGLFVINDFYVLQKIDAENLWGDLSTAEAARVAGWIFERIHIRATEELGKTLGQSIDLGAEALAALRSFVDRLPPSAARWHDILAAVMEKAAELAGCSGWGYNTPQDHLHLERLFGAFPDARIVFLLRRPEAVLRSYKNVTGPWHDRRRYNPLAVGLAWRAASRSYETWERQKPGQLLFIRYEDLVDDTPAALRTLDRFLNVNIPSIELSTLGRNSSLDGRARQRPVTPTETWIAEKVIGDHLGRRGFTPSRRRPRLGDVPAMGRLMVTTVGFVLSQVVFDADRRKRVLNLLRASRAAV